MKCSSFSLRVFQEGDLLLMNCLSEGVGVFIVASPDTVKLNS